MPYENKVTSSRQRKVLRKKPLNSGAVATSTYLQQPGQPSAPTETFFLALPLEAKPLKVLGEVDNKGLPQPTLGPD